MSSGIFAYLLFPLIPFFFIMEKWYDIFGVIDEYMFNTIYGLYAGNWMDFPNIVLTSLSGSGYIFRANVDFELWSVTALVVAILLISIPLDTFLTYQTIKRIRTRAHREKTIQGIQKSQKWFIRLYSFWRLLLPDFLIAGPLLASLLRITTLDIKQILKLNITLQLIRAGLFMGFAWLYWYLF